MEFLPELLVLQGHLRVVLHIVVLGQGQGCMQRPSRREPRKRKPCGQAGRKEALVAGRGAEAVGGAERRKADGGDDEDIRPLKPSKSRPLGALWDSDDML